MNLRSKLPSVGFQTSLQAFRVQGLVDSLFINFVEISCLQLGLGLTLTCQFQFVTNYRPYGVEFLFLTIFRNRVVQPKTKEEQCFFTLLFFCYSQTHTNPSWTCLLKSLENRVQLLTLLEALIMNRPTSKLCVVLLKFLYKSVF